MLTNLVNYSKTNTFNKTVISLLMGLRSNKEDLKKLQQAFQTFDKNKDGSLTIDEFKQA